MTTSDRGRPDRIASTERVGDRRPDDLAVLEAISEGTARSLGSEFFSSLVRTLSMALDVRYAFAAELVGGSRRVRTLAFWSRGELLPATEWDLAGTPCEQVVDGAVCHHPSGVARSFPSDRPLVELGIESYLGIPLLDAAGRPMGHLAAFDERPMPAERRRMDVFRIVAARAAAELERIRMEERLRESERRYRDLFDEAPIGYVYEDTETRFLGANRAAIAMLGLKPEEVVGTIGLSLVAPTAETQERVRRSLDSERSGIEAPFAEIELRRKDDGRPVWIQRWSRPEPDGRRTRTMLVDITARVQAEAERHRLETQNRYLREEIASLQRSDEIVGRSPALAAILRRLELVAPTETTVLVTGETGTGKELVARSLHALSPRRERPLITVNCAALPAGLIESELFGHERGAFTGASERRIGRFELADGGTLFLDEVGELPAETQVRLLRVLQERAFERVGGSKTIRVDVRIIAATNRDLLAAVADGVFRQDLFYRLSVFPLDVPPLRQRREDIPRLVHHFVGRFAARLGRSIDGVDPATMRRLVDYDWPGNVRELENVIERSVILSPGPLLEVAGEWLRQSRPASSSRPSGEALREVEREHILAILEASGWVIDGPKGAAVRLRMHPNTLRSRMRKLEVERPRHDGA